MCLCTGQPPLVGSWLVFKAITASRGAVFWGGIHYFGNSETVPCALLKVKLLEGKSDCGSRVKIARLTSSCPWDLSSVCSGSESGREQRKKEVPGFLGAAVYLHLALAG